MRLAHRWLLPLCGLLAGSIVVPLQAADLPLRGDTLVREAAAAQPMPAPATQAMAGSIPDPGAQTVALELAFVDTLPADSLEPPKPPARTWPPAPPGQPPMPADGHAMVTLLTSMLTLIVALVVFYAVRHYVFTLNRLFGKQRHPYLDIDIADWPRLTVMVAAHNEEAVIAGSLACLLRADYPEDRLTIMPVNDRSTDRTRDIIDAIVAQHPGRITPFHRTGGKPGKAAALKDACETVTSEIIVVFDADYLPPIGLLKQLVAPFFDPEVGATMGRVVPMNLSSNLLTRLLDLERSGGYQVDQQARMNLNLVPQYGGTVGGIRMRALRSAGGWHDDVLAEDTDLTYRLLLANWKTVYQNWSECYEEVPESWPVRVRQIKRWTKGHNQALYRHAWNMARCRDHGLLEKIDGLALLGIYMMAPVMLAGWLLAILLFYAGGLPSLGEALVLFALISYGTLGNFAAFFEIAAAVYLDGSRARICLLPLNYFGFLVSVLAVSRAIADQMVLDPLLRREMRWDKTTRYRQRS
ncbi:cellulose synthase/poly-beta-1,6-N-acetylglucosamine synthase-like glycosyltransferase [Cupriavidus alkaliphilus]|uniref:glycosyltransferase family 2 protein n=1 Tax=Cupriavidus alkaliphilus TaxID=942866 RepID=UPI0008159D44|nr:glycosyltransferase family 2 protein [Cupriavidus alkaliphilus]PVY70461.1 cellulose synthase/poly-beta-1,6-N-acetylglucosamine synthase-like glycosyltransferase [Cupriavidus alkaliphilus]SCB18124.1 Glycosyltransferase, catalytic subunit of cellulose synthase and poly-beta-1,6-N-acetylglucosamine synthase [Cupriavidus alkaliphilus]